MKKIAHIGFTAFIIFTLFLTSFIFASQNPTPAIEDLFTQGLTAYNAGNLQEALAKWQEGLKIAENDGVQKLIGVFTANIGLAYSGLGEYNNAINFYEKALQINKNVGDKKNTAINLNNIGAGYKELGHYEKALEYYKEALGIRRETGERRGEANTLTNMGVIFSDSGYYKEAFKSLEDAILIFGEIKDLRGETDALTNLGVVYTNIGQYDKALVTYQNALEKSQLLNDSQNQAHILGNIGAVYILREDYPKALEYYQKALIIQREANNQKDIGNNLSNIGVVYKRLGELNTALKNYEEALAIKTSLGDRLNEGVILGNIGLVYEEMGKYEEAYKNSLQSNQICMEFNLPEYLWRSLRGLGKVEAKLEKYDEAINHYLLAMDAIEKMREGLTQKEMKTSFMQDKMHVYDELIDLFIVLHKQTPSKGFDQQSFNIFERKQGRVFLEEMGQTGIRHFSGVPEEVIAEESQLVIENQTVQSAIEAEYIKTVERRDNDRIQSLQKNSADINKRLQTVQEKIKNQYPDYYALKYPKPVDLKYLQESILEPTEMILVYNVMKSSTCLWAIGKDHFSIHYIDNGSDKVAEKVTAFRDNYINIFKGQTLRGASESPSSPSGDYKPELYSILFPQPIPEIAKAYSRIYIVPTGALYLLPFEALQNDSGQYLIENHSFAYLSSASLLNVLRMSEARKKITPQYPFLAFANPLYDVPKEADNTMDELQVRSFYSIMRGNIEPLPETEDEVTRIKNILKAPESSNPLQTQKNASRSVLLNLNASGNLDDYRYISFACHGIIPDEVNGVSQPSLLLSTPDPFTKEIGLLTMADVFGLSLNADFVALSACNTGRGEVVKGEGVIGLTRAFMYAGTPAISVNLWSVETISAQKLSIEYFQTLQQGETRAEALRDSKLKLLHGESGKQFQLPFFWAPMILFGDGS